MKNGKIFDIICSVIENQIHLERPKNQNEKLSDIGIDSIGLMALIVYLEAELSIEIPIEYITELDNVNNDMTVNNIVEIVEKLLGDNE